MPCKHEGGTDPCIKSAKRNCYVQQKQYDTKRNAKPERAYAKHLHGCRARGIVNELTMEQFQWLRTQTCAYCNEPASGVDRVKSQYGYNLLNSVPCCWSCNRQKNVLHVKAFISAVNAASKHCPTYEVFKQRWLNIREELCRFTNTNASTASAPPSNVSSALLMPTNSSATAADAS